MATATTLAVDVVANTRQFTKNMAKVGRTVDNVGKKIQNVGAAVFSFRGALIGLGGAGILGGLGKILNWATDLTYAIDELGTTAENMLGLRSQFRMMGLNDAGAVQALETMERIAAQWTPGTFRFPDGNTIRALSQIGLSGGDLAAISDPAEQLETVLDRLRGVENRIVQRALAQDILGDPRLIRLLDAPEPPDFGDPEKTLRDARAANEKLRRVQEQFRATLIRWLPALTTALVTIAKEWAPEPGEPDVNFLNRPGMLFGPKIDPRLGASTYDQAGQGP